MMPYGYMCCPGVAQSNTGNNSGIAVLWIIVILIILFALFNNSFGSNKPGCGR